MKMNFKYVSMMACAALMAAFTSCSNDDAIDNGIVPNGESAKVIISLTQAAQGTRATTEAATDDEKAIKNATLYVFGADKKLVAEEVLTNATGETQLTIKTGTNYFYAAVNKIDAVPTDFVVGTTKMEDVVKSILDLASINDLTDASKGFFMTNVEKPVNKIIVASETGAENKIKIPVGRAVAKVAINLDANVSQPEDGTFALTSYQMGGSQKSMYLFPAFSGENLLTPNYDVDYAEANYFALGSEITAGDATYVVENATEERPAIQGKSTHALIKGKYTPKALLKADGTEGGTPSADGTFYRVYDKVNKVFLPGFYAEQPTGKANDEVAKYTEGICYYGYFIGDGEIDIKRNNYYKVSLVAVSGIGTNKSTGNEDLDDKPFVPGFPPIVPPDPVTEDAEILVSLDVLPWTVETVEGGI